MSAKALLVMNFSYMLCPNGINQKYGELFYKCLTQYIVTNASTIDRQEQTDKNRTYVAIDLKSFYSSVDCVARGLDPLTANLVVADVSRTEKTISKNV